MTNNQTNQTTNKKGGTKVTTQYKLTYQQYKAAKVYAYKAMLKYNQKQYNSENKNKQFIFRRSLKLILNKKMYKFFSINEEELKKFLIHINLELTNFLKKGEKVDTHDINFFIHKITEDYIQRAIIENSELEEKRLKELQNIDENGNLENGYELQKLSERFKDLDFLYKNLVIKTKEVKEEGLKIIKNSDISFEEVQKSIDELLNSQRVSISLVQSN